ncbi:hypothetical protein [Paenibacillus sp. SYP-B4298]|uniref:hypothetical protein n=1 Tax=Paenibacillus sp. SYP-B4298 TaxID=2996034 RepID=UPI0022DCF6AD|nr:hypothetical protein [Paenibacillus sp. SYP-B4298]
MKNLIANLIFLISSLMITQAVFADSSSVNNLEAKVQEFAQKEGLEVFRHLASEDPENFSFKDSADLNNAKLGQGYQVFIIDPEKLKQSNTDWGLRSVIKPTNKWEFVVYNNGEPATFISILDENGTFSVSSVGGKANDFVLAERNYREEIDAKPTLIFDKNIRYLVGEIGGKEYAISSLPNESVNNLNGFSNNNVKQTSELIKLLKYQQDDTTNAGKDSGFPFIPESESNNFNVFWISLVSAILLTGILFIIFKVRNKRAD